MADEATNDGTATRNGRSFLPVAIGAVLALIGAGGGYFAVLYGLLPSVRDRGGETVERTAKPSFVPLAPLVISIGRDGRQRHLRFSAQLEVVAGKEKPVADVLPRIVDVLNGYLRAIDLEDIEDTAALVRIRAQMLRRVQIIVGDGMVNDLLVTEFVLS